MPFSGILTPGGGTYSGITELGLESLSLTAEQKAALSGHVLAPAYDASDPNTAQRIVDTGNLKASMDALAASQGTTAPKLLEARSRLQLTTQQAQTASIVAYSTAHGFTPKTNADLYTALQTQQGAMDAAGPQPGGTYWDYAQQKWVPMAL